MTILKVCIHLAAGIRYKGGYNKKKSVLLIELHLRFSFDLRERVQLKGRIFQMADENKDLGTQGTEDGLKGKLNQAGGKIQEKAGELTGDKSTQAKGAAKQGEGKLQEAGGNVEKKIDDALK